MEITIFLPTQREIKNFTVTAILKKLYRMIYSELPLFKDPFQVFTPEILVDYDNFITYIYNGQDSFLWTLGGVEALLAVLVTPQIWPEEWGQSLSQSTDPEPSVDGEFSSLGFPVLNKTKF